MDNLRRRKAWLVTGDHMTDVPPIIAYSSLVGHDAAWLAVTLPSCNDLEVKMAEIMHAYVTAQTEEKMWIILGPEFGNSQGKKAAVHSLYGMKSAGASRSWLHEES
eukprot:CCRYP_002545-RA/>CCRYP_002545-RA protein AED:0.64 eAED:0.64 QI:0/-1/0/1/-1/1/1/0/105